MNVGQCLSQVCTHTVLTVLERIDREETDMFQIDGLVTIEVDAELCLLDGAR